MKNVKVVTFKEYYRKKDGAKLWRVTALDDEGNVICFYRPGNEEVKRGDEYTAVCKYDSFKFGYYVGFDKLN